MKRLQIIITSPKVADSRGEELNSMKKEFEELLKKFQPAIVALKDAENSQHSKVTSNILRGEVEGMLILTCYENDIEIKRLLYTTIKGLVPIDGKLRSKEFLYTGLSNRFGDLKLGDKHKDALLSAWAVLDE